MPTKNSRSMGGKAVNWTKNVGKSVKFSSIDVLRELAPNMFNTATNAQTAAQELTKDIREIKVSQSRIQKQLETYPAFRALKEWWKNAKKDIASGKLNNQERVERMAAKDMDDGFDMGEDFEFNVDDENMEFTPGPEEEGDEFSVADDVAEGMEPAVAKVEPVVAATANATRHTAIATENIALGQGQQTQAIADGFQQSTEVAKQIAMTTFTLNQKFHENTIEAFKSVNENLGKIVAFNDETISKLAMGALKYFDDQLQVSNNILAELQKISAKVAPEKPEEEPEEAPQASQLFSGRGVMKFNKYPEILKKNFIAAVEQDPFLGSIKNFLTDEEALKTLAANPLEFVSTKIATNLVPTMIKQSMKNLDDIVGSFFPALFAKIGKMKDSDNPFKQLLGKIFGLDIDVQTSPQLAQYEKDAVPFDGITHMTINTVIPEYLAGILAAVSGKEQMAFDYDTAQFTTKFGLQEKMKEEHLQAATSGYGKIMSRMKELTDKTVAFSTDALRTKYMQNVEDMFRQFTEMGTIPDWTKETPQKYGFDDTEAEIVKSIWALMEKNLKMDIGNRMFQSGQQLDRMYKDTKENKARIANLRQTTNYLANQHVDRTVNENTEYDYEIRRNEEMDWRKDTEYAKSQTDLLREIKGLLMEGIIVFPKGTAAGESGVSGVISGTNTTVEARLAAYQTSMKSANDEKARHEESRRAKIREDLEELKKKGFLTNDQIRRMERENPEQLKQLLETLKDKNDNKTQQQNKKKNEMGGVYEWLDKWFNEATFGQKVADIRKAIDKFFQTPAKFLRDSMDKISDALYAVIYGDDDTKSFIGLAKDKMKETFENFNQWLKKKWNATTNYLFGEGGLTETKTFKWVKGKSEKLFDLLFGTKNADGVRQNGAFSEAFNSISDVFLNVRGELFGTPYKDSKGVEHTENKSSVVHELKAGISDAFGQMRKYLFGEPKKDAKGNDMSFLDEMTEMLGKGFTNWKNFFFGTKTSEEDGKLAFKGITEDFKQHLPKALAVGIVGAGIGLFTNFGLLGSLFLPGGPIGGAILGTAVGFLGQSEKFKNFLFGAKGVDGMRQGGIISKSVQSWVIKHKTALIGGATFGALKGIIGSFMPAIGGPLGFMGSFLLPGGPITGALMGAAIGIGWKSQTFQNFLYGKQDKDGKRMGGILNSEMGKGMKKHMPNVAFGALTGGAAATVIGQMGFLGAMLTPMGPLGGAILGAATGIAVSSEKFRKFLFGEKDEKTGFKKAGLLNRISNIFTFSIVEPFKIRMAKWGIEIKHWFKKDIANRFLSALEPFKVQFKLMAKDMKEMFARGWKFLTDSINGIFERAVGLPLGKFLEEKVLKPMRSFMDKLVGGIGKIFGAILSSPFKAMSAMAGALMVGQQARGLKENREERRDALKQAAGEFSSLLGAKFKSLFGIGGQETASKASSGSLIESAKSLFSAAKDNVTQYSEKQTAEDKKKYIDADAVKADKAKRDKEADEEYRKELAALEAREKSVEMRRDIATKNNFDTVAYDKEGNVIADLSKVYDMKVPLSEIDLHTQEQTTILGAIKNTLSRIFQSSEKANMIAAAMAYHETGNEEFVDMGNTEPGTVAESGIPSNLKSSSVAENAKEKQENEQAVAEQEAKDVKEQQAAEEAGKPADSGKKPKLRDLLSGTKEKFKITEESILNLISSIPENASAQVKEYYEKAIDRMMRIFSARSDKDKTTTATPAVTTTSETPGTVATPTPPPTASSTTSTTNAPGTVATPTPTAAPKPSEEGGGTLQKILDQLRINAQMQAALLYQNQQKATPIKANASDSREEREFDSKNKVRKGADPSLKYLRIIASSVDGQLNGVGSNVYKSRRLLEVLSGVSSNDITGSNNKDRVTLLGRAQRFITMMIFHPIEFLGSMIMKPFQVIADIGKKVWNTAWNIIDGVGTAITKTANAVVEVGKKALDVVLAVPKMVIDIIGGVAEVAKETLVTGIKVIGEGLTGLISASFKIINGAAEAMGSAIKGLGKGIGAVFKGVGKITEELMSGVGKAISGTISIIGTFGKTTIEVAGGIAKGLTSIATTAMEGVTKVANTLVSGVTNLITSAGSAIFSLAASPFRFLGNLGKGLIMRSSHVIVDGGTIDTVRNIERVEKIVVLEKTGREGEETSFWESMKARFGVGSTQSGAAADSGNPQYTAETPGTVSVDQGETAKEEKPKEEAGKPASEQESTPKKKEDDKTGTPAEKPKEEKTEKPGTVATTQQPQKETSKNVEEAGKPAATNVTSDMLKSGVVTNTSGPVQRTAAVTKAIAEANSEKELMKTNELQQTSWLEKLYNKAQERTGMFGKLLKWLAGAALLLWGWLGKLKNALTLAGIGKFLSDKLGQALKNLKVNVAVSDGMKTAWQAIKKDISEGFARAFGRISGFGKLVGEGLHKAFGNVAESIRSRFGTMIESVRTRFSGMFEGILKKFGIETGKDAAKAGAEATAGKIAIGEAAEGTLKLAANARGPVALLTAGGESAVEAIAEQADPKAVKEAAKKRAEQMAGKFSIEEVAKLGSQGVTEKIFTGTAEENKALYHRLAQQFHPDRFFNASAADKEIAETAMRNLNVAKDSLVAGIRPANVAPSTVINMGDATKNVAAENLAEQAPKWLEKIKDAIYGIEKFVCEQTGKNIKFADGLWNVIKKFATPQLLAQNSGKIAAAAAEGEVKGAVGMNPWVFAVFTAYNTASGLYDAAHMFKVNSEAVTMVMRLCAAIVKVIIGAPFPAWSILTAVLMVICSLFGVDMRGWLAQELYKILVDTKSAKELEAEQSKFAEEAKAKGYTRVDAFGNTVVDVDKYNDEVNTTVFQHVWNGIKTGYNDFKEWAAPKIDNAKQWIGAKYDTVKDFVVSIPDRFRNFKDAVGEKIDAIGETVSQIPAKIGEVKDSISKTAHDVWGWAFGKWDPDGGGHGKGRYIPGFFDDPIGVIGEGLRGIAIDALTANNFSEEQAIELIDRATDTSTSANSGEARREIVSAFIGFGADTISSAFSGVKDWFADKLGWVYDGVSGLLGDAYTKADEVTGGAFTRAGNWVFGYNDENGNYVPGFFANAKAFITNGFASITASILNTTPEELDAGMTEHGAAIYITSKILGVDVKRVKKSKRIQALQTAWLNIFGGTDKEGNYHTSLVEDVENFASTLVDSFSKVFPSVEEMFLGTEEEPKAFGIFYYPLSKWASRFATGVEDFCSQFIDGLDKLAKINWMDDVILGTKEHPKGLGEVFWPLRSALSPLIDPVVEAAGLLVDAVKKGIDYLANKNWMEDVLMGTKEKPKGFGVFIYPITDLFEEGSGTIKKVFNAFIDGLTEGLGRIPDLITDFITDAIPNVFKGILSSFSDSFDIAWAKMVNFILGDEEYNQDVRDKMVQRRHVEIEQQASFVNAIKPQEYKFRGSGVEERYTMSDSAYRSKKYGNEPGMETYEETACAPVTAANILGVDPQKAADFAVAGGYRVAGGTTEDFFPAIANAVGAQSAKLDSIGDMVSASNAGMRIAVGGIGKDFTKAGHYSEAIPDVDGVHIKDSRGPEYDKTVDYDTFSKEAKTAYAFTGSGAGDSIDLPDFSSIDASQGNLLKQVGGVLFDWFTNGGILGLMRNLSNKIDNLFNDGLTVFGNWLFGVDLGEKNRELNGFLREKITSGVDAIFGAVDTSKKAAVGILNKFNDWANTGFEKARDWMFADIPTKLGLLKDAVTSGIDFIFGKRESDGFRRGGVVGKLESDMLSGIDTAISWIFGNIPGGQLIVDSARSVMNYIFGKEESDGIRRGGVFKKLSDFIEKKLEDVKNWIIGKVPGGSILVDTITKTIPQAVEEFGKNMVKGLSDKWDEFKKKALNFGNINLKDLFKEGLKAVANKITGSGDGDKLFTGSGQETKPVKFKKPIPDKKFTGSGNKVFAEQQVGPSCTVYATRLMYRAYKDEEINPDYSSWDKYMDAIAQETPFGEDENEQSKFVSFVEDWFSKKPGHPLFLYQTDGAGSPEAGPRHRTDQYNGKIHPINRWSGDHATVIGRKRSDGLYEDYDSNEAKVHVLKLEEIFDRTAHGGGVQAPGIPVGHGNTLWVPTIEPSQPITEWQGEDQTAGTKEPESAEGNRDDAVLGTNPANTTSPTNSSGKSNWDKRGILGLLSSFQEGFSGNDVSGSSDNNSPISDSNSPVQLGGKGLSDVIETGLTVDRTSKLGKPTHITIHNTGAADNTPISEESANKIDPSAKEIHAMHSPGGSTKITSGVAYHFIVRRNGDIERGCPEDIIGEHTGAHNSHNLGIHVGGHFNYGTPSNEQIASTTHLIADLSKKYGITIDQDHVVGHKEWYDRIAPDGKGTTDCPGTNLFDKLPSIRDTAKKALEAPASNPTDGSSITSPGYKAKYINTGKYLDDYATYMSDFAKERYGKDVPTAFWRIIMVGEQGISNEEDTSYNNNPGGMDYADYMAKEFGASHNYTHDNEGNAHDIAKFDTIEHGLQCQVDYFCNDKTHEWAKEELALAQQGKLEEAFRIHTEHYIANGRPLEEQGGYMAALKREPGRGMNLRTGDDQREKFTGSGEFEKFYKKFVGSGTTAPGEEDTWVRQGDWVSLDGAKESTIGAIADLGKWTKEKTGDPLVVTAVTNGSHAGGEFSHANGWKIDVNSWGRGVKDYFNTGNYMQPHTQTLDEFIEYGHSLGLGMSDENDHIDIQTGNNGYEWSTGQYFGGYKNPNGTVSSVQPTNTNTDNPAPTASTSPNPSGSSSKGPDTVLGLFNKYMFALGKAANMSMSGKVFTDQDWNNIDGSGAIGSSSASDGARDSGKPTGPVAEGDVMSEEQVWDWFRSKGYNANATAGIMGRVKQEHNFDPKLSAKKIHYDPEYGGELGGMGIFQWTWDSAGKNLPDTNLDIQDYFKQGMEMHPDSRLANYIRWADKNNKPYESSSSELNYFWEEDKDKQSYFANYYCGIPDWNPDTLNKYDYSTVSSFWTQGFERGDPSSNDAAYAKEFYDKYKDRVVGSGEGDKFIGSGRNFSFVNYWKMKGMKPTAHGDVTKGDISKISVSSARGGEYFSEPDKATQESKDYAAGTGNLESVAKSVGFDNIPDDTEKIDAEVQQKLGYRQYNPVRRWVNYTVDSDLWKNSGKTQVDSWADSQGFVGSGIKGTVAKFVARTLMGNEAADQLLANLDDKLNDFPTLKKVLEAASYFDPISILTLPYDKAKELDDKIARGEIDPKTINLAELSDDSFSGYGTGKSFAGFGFYKNLPDYKGPSYNLIENDDSGTVQEAKRKLQLNWIKLNTPNSDFSINSEDSAEFERDPIGNIIGLDIPEYNVITGDESLPVRNAKMEAQAKQFWSEKGFKGSGFNLKQLGKVLLGGIVGGFIMNRQQKILDKVKRRKEERGKVASEAANAQAAKIESQKKLLAGLEDNASGEEIKKVCDEIGMEFDTSGNVQGIDIPEELKITAEDNDTDKYAKQLKQIKGYFDYGGGKPVETISKEDALKTFGLDKLQGDNIEQADINAVVKNLNLTFDDLGNVQGIEIPEDLRVTDFNDPEKYTKQRKQIQGYFDYGGKTPDGKVLGKTTSVPVEVEPADEMPKLSLLERLIGRYWNRKTGKSKQGYGDILGYGDGDERFKGLGALYENIPEYKGIPDNIIDPINDDGTVQEAKHVMQLKWVQENVKSVAETPVKQEAPVIAKENEPSKVEEEKPGAPAKKKRDNFFKRFFKSLFGIKSEKEDIPEEVAEIPKFATRDDIFKRYGLDKLQSDKGTQEDIDSVVKNLNLTFDDLGNVQGIEIPEDLRVTDFNDPEKYKKQYVQMQKYFELGGKTPDGKTLDSLLKEPFKKTDKLDTIIVPEKTVTPIEQIVTPEKKIEPARDIEVKPTELIDKIGAPSIVSRIDEDIQPGSHAIKEAQELNDKQEESNNQKIWNRMVDLLQAIVNNTSGIDKGFDSLSKMGDKTSTIFERPGRTNKNPNDYPPQMIMGRQRWDNDRLSEEMRRDITSIEPSEQLEFQRKIASGGEFKRVG